MNCNNELLVFQTGFSERKEKENKGVKLKLKLQSAQILPPTKTRRQHYFVKIFL